jgi:hypothetical protein
MHQDEGAGFVANDAVLDEVRRQQVLRRDLALLAGIHDAKHLPHPAFAEQRDRSVPIRDRIFEHMANIAQMPSRMRVSAFRLRARTCAQIFRNCSATLRRSVRRTEASASGSDHRRLSIFL